MYYINNELLDCPGYNGLIYKLNTSIIFTNNYNCEYKVKGRGKNG